MAIEYLCSDHQILGDQALSYVQQYYPGVTEVYCARRADDMDRNHTDPGTIRVRSRGRHNPGSGSYFCSHIDPPGKINGYLVGNKFYATNLPLTGIATSSRVWKASYSYGSWEEESFTRGPRWSNYTSNTAVFVSTGSTVRWRVMTLRSSIRGGSYDDCKVAALASEPEFSEWQWGRRVSINEYTHIPEPTFEERYMRDKIDSGALPNLDVYLNAAYLEAFKSLPVVKTNNIQNLFAAFGILKGFVAPFITGDKLVSGIGSAGDAWLQHRYVYNTTKSDIQELAAVVDRCRNLSDGQTFRSYGSYSATYGGDTYLIKCSLSTRLSDVFNCYTELERLGLALDGYNAWDLIPYSFMVDWFLRIGNLIESGRDWSHALKLAPSITDSWFSITHTFTNKTGGLQCDYYRWPCTGVSAALPASMLTHQQPGLSTWIKRGVDALAIFT